MPSQPTSPANKPTVLLCLIVLRMSYGVKKGHNLEHLSETQEKSLHDCRSDSQSRPSRRMLIIFVPRSDVSIANQEAQMVERAWRWCGRATLFLFNGNFGRLNYRKDVIAFLELHS